MGIVAGDGGAIIWPWLVGPARAKELADGPVLAIRWPKLSVNKPVRA